MITKLSRQWWLLAMRGTLAILFGLLALLWPGITLLSLSALFAAFALVGGAIWVFAAIANRQEAERWRMLLVLGLLGMAAGAVAVLHPALTTLLLVLLVGANALVGGVVELAVAVRLREQIRGEWMLALTGVASVLFGLALLLFPAGMGIVALGILIGMYAIATGILALVLAIRVRRRLSDLQAHPAGSQSADESAAQPGAGQPAVQPAVPPATQPPGRSGKDDPAHGSVAPGI